MSELPEEWRSVPGYDGLYEVSDAGRVRSLERTVLRRVRGGAVKPYPVRARILKQCSVGDYRTVALYGGPRDGTTLVHGLVAEAFLGPRPDGLMVLHGDGVGSNNFDDNLRYGDGVDNSQDAHRHGTIPLGEHVHNAVLTNEEAGAIKALRGPRCAARLLSERFRIRKTYVYHLWYGLVWQTVEALPLDRALAVALRGGSPAFCKALHQAFRNGESGAEVVRRFAAYQAEGTPHG